MNAVLKRIGIGSMLFTLLLVGAVTLYAEEATSEAVVSIENKIKEYQSKLNELGGQKRAFLHRLPTWTPK